MKKIEKISLIGLGAMGVFFAPRIFKFYGNNFKVIANGDRKKRLEEKGVTINGENYKFPVISSDSEYKADLILIGVKEYSLDEAIEDIRGQVREDTIIISLLNGVDSEERLAAAFGEKHILYAYMRMSIVMRDQKADFDPYWGKIHFGEKDNKNYSDRVLAVKEVFDNADIPYEIDRDMIKGIWFKYMCNVGENMTCALLGIPFGAFRNSDNANWIRINAMREVAEIARKKGIDLGETEIEKQNKTIITIPPENKPSTLQDLECGKHTEVDMFAGTVIRLGKELGIETPIAKMFYYGIMALEERGKEAKV